MALQYGKRPVYLISMLTTIIVLATGPLCRHPGTYLANRILLGFFGAPCESLPEISVTDIWFTHERAKYLAWYGWSLSLTGKLAPMLSGFINIGMGWEWTLWWCAIWVGMGFVYCFLFLEETNYDRVHSHAQESAPETTGGVVKEASGSEKSPKAVDEPQADTEVGQVQWPRKSFVDKLGVRDRKRPNRILDIMLGPFKGFTYPAVVWAG